MTTEELLKDLENKKELFEDSLFLFTTGHKDVNMKKLDEFFKEMKKTMKELRKRGMEIRND